MLNTKYDHWIYRRASGEASAIRLRRLCHRRRGGSKTLPMAELIVMAVLQAGQDFADNGTA